MVSADNKNSPNEIVIHYAKELGFDLVGFAKADKFDKEIVQLENWLSEHYQAGMTYMERNIEKRKDVREIMPEAESVISLGMNYFVDKKQEEKKGYGKVSRYAWGKDYHLIMWEKTEELIEMLKEIFTDFEAKAYVDTGPVLDKAWAVRAGIGWMGKHSNIINRNFGSWFFIAEIITNQVFDYNEVETDLCGSCTACIDSCPTEAIVEDYVVDANKCISYLTIENKGEIPEEFAGKMDGWVFGCDVCQDVCPWNKKFAQVTRVTEFHETPNVSLDLEEIMNMTNSLFKKKFSLSPIKRARLKGIKRNAEFLERDSQ